MSGVKHTPGPWRIDVNGSDKWSVDYEGPSSTYMTICARGRRAPVGFAVEPSAWGNDEEIEANARLIAAAPCMFEYILSSAQNGCATAQEIVERATGDLPEKGGAL